MAVLKKQFEIGSKTIWVRQASGMERLRFETMLAKTFRRYKHFGFDQSTWTDEQQEEFMVALEEMGGGMESQILSLVPPCILDEGCNMDLLDRDELMEIFEFVRGDDPEGAVPLDS